MIDNYLSNVWQINQGSTKKRFTKAIVSLLPESLPLMYCSLPNVKTFFSHIQNLQLMYYSQKQIGQSAAPTMLFSISFNYNCPSLA